MILGVTQVLSFQCSNRFLKCSFQDCKLRLPHLLCRLYLHVHGMYLAINLSCRVDKVGLKPVKLLLDQTNLLNICRDLSVYFCEVSGNHSLDVVHLLFVIFSDSVAGSFQLVGQLLVAIL